MVGSMSLAVAATTADEESLRAQVRGFLQQEKEEHGLRIGLGMAAGYDPLFSRRLAQRGWVGMSVPATYGGSGYSAVQRFVVVEELLAAGAPVTAHWIADRQIAPSIQRYGTPAQRERFLPAITRGECFFSLGMSEPDAGSDLASVRTTAAQVPGGWRLNGVKIWTSLSHLNHFVLVLARVAGTTPAQRQLVQLIVDLSSPGIDVKPILLLTGEHHFNALFLNDVHVPDSALLGEPGAGWDQVTNELVLERSGPDRFLSTLPLVRLFIAELRSRPDDHLATVLGRALARLWAVRQMALAVARLLDSGLPASVYSAMAKDLGTILEQDMVEAVRRLGDIQVVQDSDSEFMRLLEEAVLMAPSFTIRGGTTEVLRSIIARRMHEL
jgi:alkylation response protein AidB-like acyl-CoA dehydrogenase